ncbi:MAG: mitochondrial membrane protein [Phylliscum demangeonii]|nr:MAG: mitochondrial membrane protein [Phylliscum demangeonii]
MLIAVVRASSLLPTDTLVRPDAADAESPLSPDELQTIRKQYEKEGENVTLQTKFNYAWGLIKSTLRPEQQEGVRLLSEIYRASPERRRECLYYLGLGHYKLGNYAEARRYNDSLLKHEPHNLQADSLKNLIDDRVTKDGMIGVAISLTTGRMKTFAAIPKLIYQLRATVGIRWPGVKSGLRRVVKGVAPPTGDCCREEPGAKRTGNGGEAAIDIGRGGGGEALDVLGDWAAGDWATGRADFAGGLGNGD